MSLLSVFDSISHEIGDDLLYASFVKACVEDLIGIVFDELDFRLLHTLLDGLADVIEELCEVHVSGFDGKRT